MKAALLSLFAASFLAGCINQSANQTGTPSSPDSTEQTRSADSTAPEELSEISKAIESGKAVNCTLTDNTGISMNYYLKGKKFKIVGMQGGQPSETITMISDGEIVYNWSDESKMGTKMKVIKPEGIDQNSEAIGDSPDDLSKPSQPSDLKDFYDQGYDIKCSPSEIADSEFVVPADVKFTDLTEMMQGLGTPPVTAP